MNSFIILVHKSILAKNKCINNKNEKKNCLVFTLKFIFEIKSFISCVNWYKMLEFAKTFINKPIEFWKEVIVSDQNKYNMAFR